MSGDVYVVTYGEGRHVDGVHGVFADKKRAEMACEELQRIYDDPREWAAVESHEFITTGADEYEVSDV